MLRKEYTTYLYQDSVIFFIMIQRILILLPAGWFGWPIGFPVPAWPCNAFGGGPVETGGPCEMGGGRLLLVELRPDNELMFPPNALKRLLLLVLVILLRWFGGCCNDPGAKPIIDWMLPPIGWCGCETECCPDVWKLLLWIVLLTLEGWACWTACAAATGNNGWLKAVPSGRGIANSTKSEKWSENILKIYQYNIFP